MKAASTVLRGAYHSNMVCLLNKQAFKSISSKIMPYVIAKTLFLYVFHEKYNQLDPCLFSSETKQESEIKQQIRILRNKACNYSISESELDRIFKGLISVDNYRSESPIEKKMKTVFTKVQNLWIDDAKGKNNLFMQCWKEVASILP